MENTADIRASDRLSMSLFLTTVLHAIVILGVTFSPIFNNEKTHDKEIVLSNDMYKQFQKNAHILSNAHLIHSAKENEDNNLKDAYIKPSRVNLTISKDLYKDKNIFTANNMQVIESNVINKENNKNLKNRTDLLQSNSKLSKEEGLATKLALLMMQLAQDKIHYTQQPRIEYVSSVNAKFAVEAKYIKQWTNKVEYLGNYKYQPQFAKKNLQGKVVLSVLFDHKGKILRTVVNKTSGKQHIDNAAVAIAYASSPYKPFPKEMREVYDQLMVTRTWIFTEKEGLVTNENVN